MTGAPSPLEGRPVLVTGASGFLGRHLTRRLLELGAEVHATSRVPRGGEGRALRWWQADLSDADAARKLVRETAPARIFHLAGAVSAAPKLELVVPTFQSLLASTVNLLAAAAESGAGRVVLAASLTEPEPGAEPVPGSPYAAAKWASSGYARMFHALWETPVVLARVYMAYGPGQDAEKLVPHVIRELLHGRAPRLSSGRFRADWIYVEDAVEGMLAAASAPGLDGQTIDLGTGRLTSVREVAEHLAAIVGGPAKPAFGALPDRPLEPERCADPERAERQLGWRPRVPLEEGLRRTVDALRRELDAPVRP